MNTQRQAQQQSKSQETAVHFGWTRSSYFLLSAFLVTLLLLSYVWWPLAKEYLEQFDPDRSLWRQIDWLLIGIFLVMTVLIMAGADLKKDVWILSVGLAGGLVIESWGTQTELWTYYTLERPPLWIIPAWPIASLSIDRLIRLMDRRVLGNLSPKLYSAVYWVVFVSFMALMLPFVWPTLDKPLTIAALLLCAMLILTPTDRRLALITFGAGSALGFFLEYWGTTRLCWTYYTEQTPPLFAVLAHGMAAVAFWRSSLLLQILFSELKSLAGRSARREPSL